MPNIFLTTLKMNTVFPHIVSAHLCTVTFGFPNSKKNSFRGNYMTKYSSKSFDYKMENL